jgi:hypothetical protein
VLALSERRGRITPAKSSEFIALLETLDVVVDDETPSGTLDRVLDLARAERLTAYDAAYLELHYYGVRCVRGGDRKHAQIASAPVEIPVLAECAELFRPTPLHLLSGEAGDHWGKGIQVRLLYRVVGDPPALSPRENLFNHVLDGPNQHVRTL